MNPSSSRCNSKDHSVGVSVGGIKCRRPQTGRANCTPNSIRRWCRRRSRECQSSYLKARWCFLRSRKRCKLPILTKKGLSIRKLPSYKDNSYRVEFSRDCKTAHRARHSQSPFITSMKTLTLCSLRQPAPTVPSTILISWWVVEWPKPKPKCSAIRTSKYILSNVEYFWHADRKQMVGSCRGVWYPFPLTTPTDTAVLFYTVRIICTTLDSIALLLYSTASNVQWPTPLLRTTVGKLHGICNITNITE